MVISTHLPPPVIIESTAALAFMTHILCWSCGMYFSAATSSENDQAALPVLIAPLGRAHAPVGPAARVAGDARWPGVVQVRKLGWLTIWHKSHKTRCSAPSQLLFTSGRL